LILNRGADFKVDADKKIQKEIVNRVLKLDGKRNTLSVRDLELESTIDTLVDFTAIPREDIEIIAREVRLAHENTPPLKARLKRFVRDSGFKLAGAVLASLLIIGVYQFLQPGAVNSSTERKAVTKGNSGSLDEREEKVRQLYITRAEIASVLSTMSIFKNMIVEYYMRRNEYPDSLSQFGLEETDMTDDRYIKQVRLGKDGAIIADLMPLFGNSKHLALIPKPSMGGLQLSWHCITDLPESIFDKQPFFTCTPGKSEKVF